MYNIASLKITYQKIRYFYIKKAFNLLIKFFYKQCLINWANMYISYYKIIFLQFLFFSFSVFGANDLIGRQYLCSRVLWGFDFFSSEKVNVIRTDINKQSIIKQYYYAKNPELPFINLYVNKENKENIIFSIQDQTFRVDVWTMTSGGITTREIIPEGICEEVKIKNMLQYIEDLKKIN